MNKFKSACGLNCNKCECYEATQANDLERKKDIATRWSKNYDANLSPDAITCNGCLSDGPRFSWCDNCPIRACVQSRGYDNCSECADFPCETNDYVYNAVPEVRENIAELRKG